MSKTATIREMRERELHTQTKSKDYENSVNRYASWAYQQTFLVFMLNFLGFTVTLKKNKEGNTHRFARIQSIVYQIDNDTLNNILSENVIPNEFNKNNSNEFNRNEFKKNVIPNEFNEMDIENNNTNENSIVSISQNCQNNQSELCQIETNGNDKINSVEITELCVSEQSENVIYNNESVENKNVIYNTNIPINKNVIYNTKYWNVNFDEKTNTTQFILFEDTEYFESICSTNQKRVNGNKNINDFAKMNSLFMMYFFNTFGIEFKIKGEGKTFPMITEIRFKDQVISNGMIQDFGRRHFSEMVRGQQLTPESILMKERECDEELYTAICQLFMSIQESVYTNVKEYLLFIQFITNKFYNLYCNDDRDRVKRMWEEGDDGDLKYVKSQI